MDWRMKMRWGRYLIGLSLFVAGLLLGSAKTGGECRVALVDTAVKSRAAGLLLGRLSACQEFTAVMNKNFPLARLSCTYDERDVYVISGDSRWLLNGKQIN